MWASSAAATEPVDEVELLRALLSGPAFTAQLTAAEAQADARGTAPPVLSNPELQGRYEDARGQTGATTEGLGASLSIDLGFADALEARAASLRRRAGHSQVRALRLEAICQTRARALDLWALGERRHVAGLAHDRLDGVVALAEQLATAGEVSGFDRDRVLLAASVHRVSHDQAESRALGLRAELWATTGLQLDSIRLLPVGPLEDRATLVAAALETDPVRRSLQLERDAAETSLRARRRAAVPDLVVQGGARWDRLPGASDRARGFEIGGALEIPLFDRHQQEIADARGSLAWITAEQVQREAEVRARVDAAWHQVHALSQPAETVDGTRIWEGARSRYASGEGSIEELLAVADDVEAAALAHVTLQRLNRRAHLDLACAVGRFVEPTIQRLLEVAP